MQENNFRTNVKDLRQNLNVNTVSAGLVCSHFWVYRSSINYYWRSYEWWIDLRSNYKLDIRCLFL